MKSLFEISRSGLRSAERSLSVTSNNVINADTPGYSRQRVDKSPVGMQKSNYHAGLGVNIDGVNRLRDEMNDLLRNEKQQDMGYMQEKARVFEQLEAGMTSDGGGDLDHHISSMFDAFSDLSSDPQDLSIRNNVVSVTQQLSTKLNSLSRNLDRSSDLVKDSAGATVESVNNLLEDIHSLNGAIRQGQAQGNPDHASLDLRVQKLEELSELVNFEAQENDTGTMELRIGGLRVLDETSAYRIRPEIDDTNKTFRLRLESGQTLTAGGGKLGAQVEMYEEEIPDLKEGLNNVASTIIEEVNQLQSQGSGLDNETASHFFEPTGGGPGAVDAAQNIRVNSRLVENPRLIAASDTAGEAGNGEMAARMADLRNRLTVESNGSSKKLSDFSIELISRPGSQLNELNSRIQSRDSELQMLKVQQERQAGVNIDEELSLMIQYRNAYQGAARVMSTAQEMYDTLIDITR